MSQILISSWTMLLNITSIIAWITPFFCCLGIPFIPLTAHWDVLSESAIVRGWNQNSPGRSLEHEELCPFGSSWIFRFGGSGGMEYLLHNTGMHTQPSHSSWFKVGQFITYLFLNEYMNVMIDDFVSQDVAIKICTQRGGQNLITYRTLLSIFSHHFYL